VVHVDEQNQINAFWLQFRVNHGAEHWLDVPNLFLGRLIFEKAKHLALDIDRTFAQRL